MSDGKTGEQVYIEQLEAAHDKLQRGLKAAETRVAELEAALKWQREHTELLETNWEALVDSTRAQRDAALKRVAELEEECKDRQGTEDSFQDWNERLAEQIQLLKSECHRHETELQTIHAELSAITGCATDGHNAVQMVQAMKSNLRRKREDLVEALELVADLFELNEAGCGPESPPGRAALKQARDVIGEARATP